MGPQHGFELPVGLDRDDPRRVLQQGQGKRADARPDLHHALGSVKGRQVHDLLDHVVIDQEVLAEPVLGRQAIGLKKRPGGAGVCQRRGRHVVSVVIMPVYPAYYPPRTAGPQKPDEPAARVGRCRLTRGCKTNWPAAPWPQAPLIHESAEPFSAFAQDSFI